MVKPALSAPKTVENARNAATATARAMKLVHPALKTAAFVQYVGMTSVKNHMKHARIAKKTVGNVRSWAACRLWIVYPPVLNRLSYRVLQTVLPEVAQMYNTLSIRLLVVCYRTLKNVAPSTTGLVRGSTAKTNLQRV